MGNSFCVRKPNYQTTQSQTLVLQTGKLRGEELHKGYDSMSRTNPSMNQHVVHRWLPSELESKYEAIDFVEKFGMFHADFLNIYNGENHLLNVNSFMNGEFQPPESLLDNVNIIVSCGSTSIQAFKITPKGPKVLLPITDSVKNDTDIRGQKTDTNLNFETMNFFGGSSDSSEIALSMIEYLNQNAYRVENGKEIPTKIIMVNQIGYSILGFNPRDGSPAPIPTQQQKVVSIKNYTSFKTNKNKTNLIVVLQNIMAQETRNDNLWLVCRQCKIKDPNGIEQELSGQWAHQAHKIMTDEKLMKLIYHHKTINRIIDLGGNSGTFYNRVGDKFVKDATFKEFMKTDETKPNNFSNNLSGFVDAFQREYVKITSN